MSLLRLRPQLHSRLVAGTVITAVIGLGAAALVANAAPASKPPTAVGAPKPGAAPAPSTTPEAAEFFEKKIRPILVESCYGCHAPTGKSVQGNLRLTDRAALLKGGDRGPSLVSGHPEQSLLVKAVTYDDRDLQMPPKGKLPADQIQALTEWVKMGAPWPAAHATAAPVAASWAALFQQRKRHWAFQPLRASAPPRVRNQAWVKTPVDNFILAELEKRNLTPAGPADRRTLIRRVTFDLTGLPPTPAEVDSFVNDHSPDAYRKVVERLLASPHYGERWARHWLDLVRFAETDGHEFDFDKPAAYQYRDYLIRAFNADVPYNRFVQEHVAGDLLQKPRIGAETHLNESLLATGFWWLGEGKHSPVDLRDDQAERVDNQIDVLGKTFLGLTLGCARCHDHKFDAIATKDYYALFGILASSRYRVANAEDPQRLKTGVQQIRALDAQLQPALVAGAAASLRKQLESTSSYLLAARELLAAGPGTNSGPSSDDEVFEDFEKPTYAGWTTTGTAFGDGPNHRPLPEYQGEVEALGNGFVNTHSALLGGQRQIGDQRVGTLTSREFSISRPYIRFLVGGGAHADRTCVHLMVNGKAVRTATGHNDNRMAWAVWDVSELRGKTARFQIIDQETGPWGNIGVDEIFFSNESGAGDERSDTIARSRGLDAARLRQWVTYLRQVAAPNREYLVHPWTSLAAQTGPQFTEKATGFGLARAAGPASQDVVFEDFSKPNYAGWYVSGEAFGEGPSRCVSVLAPSPNGLVVRSVVARAAESGRISPRLTGALRSRSFTLDKGRIHFHTWGQGGQINLVIDGFQRIRFPIYGGLTLGVNSATETWQSMDVAQWKGHSAYIEIQDLGPGTIAVDRIVFSDGAAPAEAPNPLRAQLFKPAPRTPEELADRYARLLQETLEQWGSGSLAGAPDAAERAEVLNAALLMAPPLPVEGNPTVGQLLARRRELEAALPGQALVMAADDGTPEDERVHIRGSARSLGEMVPRRFLEAIAGPNQPSVTNECGRLALAERMTAPSNPLLSRVMVNRIWQHHFGEGIVRTPDDFGIRGERPTHPELLDWLTSEFGRRGWSMKQMHRLIVLSSTYQMSSKQDARAEEIDPQDKLLHRMPVRRLEAEAIRDSVLAVSGRLDPKLYGPSVLPFLTPFMEGRGRPAAGPLDGEGRRSVYLSVRRNFLTPMFLAFDYPIPFTTIGRRSTSTVPAQALTMMNNTFVLQQAEVWARKVLGEKSTTPKERVEQMYETAFARLPTESELTSALGFVAEQEKTYGPDGQVHAWADLCHVLMNVKEFIFIN